MVLTGIFIGSFFIAFSGAMAPGPLFAITLTDSYRYGAKAGPLLIVGHALLELLFIIFFIIGLIDILKSELVFKIVVLSGCIMLFFMGTLMLVSVKENFSIRKEKKYSLFPLPIKGIMATLSNPYWFFWWITVGLAYFSISFKYGIKGVIVFFIGHILADFLWYSFVSWGLWKNKNIFEGKFYKILSYISGASLIGFAFFFIVRFFL